MCLLMNARSDFGLDRTDMNLKVWAYPTRGMPAAPSLYHTSIFGGATGPFHNSGPRTSYPDVFTFLSCATTVPHFEITCVAPEGYGGQLEWRVEVLDLVSLPFR